MNVQKLCGLDNFKHTKIHIQEKAERNSWHAVYKWEGGKKWKPAKTWREKKSIEKMYRHTIMRNWRKYDYFGIWFAIEIYTCQMLNWEYEIITNNGFTKRMKQHQITCLWFQVKEEEEKKTMHDNSGLSRNLINNAAWPQCYFSRNFISVIIESSWIAMHRHIPIMRAYSTLMGLI